MGYLRSPPWEQSRGFPTSPETTQECFAQMKPSLINSARSDLLHWWSYALLEDILNILIIGIMQYSKEAHNPLSQGRGCPTEAPLGARSALVTLLITHYNGCATAPLQTPLLQLVPVQAPIGLHAFSLEDVKKHLVPQDRAPNARPKEDFHPSVVW